MNRITGAGLLLLASISAALAQSSPGLIYGQVPTAAQWNSYFAAKQNTLGYTPVNKAGDVMTGKLVTAPSTTLQAGFGLPAGSTPTSPLNGDMWSTTVGIFARVNGVTQGPFVGASSSTFAATAPITVSFPASVVTYALSNDTSLTVGGGALGINLAHSNTFTAAQSINLNAASLPSPLSNTALNIAAIDTSPARVQLNSFGSNSSFTGVGYGGTGASPTAVTSGTEVLEVNAFAYNGAAVVGPIGYTRFFARENIASGHQGSGFCIGTTPIAGTLAVDGLCQFSDRGIILESPTGSSQGAGTINLTGGYYVNGAPIAPITAGALGTILRGTSTSTAPTWTTATYPATTTISQILYSSSANVVAGLATANSGVLITSSGGVPSISSTLPSALTIPSPAFTGQATGNNTIPFSILNQASGLSLLGNISSSASNVINVTGTANQFVGVNSGGTAMGFQTMAGDATLSGASLVLATVNSNVGSFGSSTAIPSFTVNGKGLITAASTNVVIAPAGTVTGTTLASNVVTSSLTTVGALAGGSITTGFAMSGTISGTPAFSGANFITRANLAQVAAVSLMGNPTGSLANESAITLGSTLNFSGTTLNVTTSSSSQFGAAKCDNTTITCASGIYTAIGGSATSVTIGTTSIISGTTGRVFYDNAAVIGEATVGTGIALSAGALKLSLTNASLQGGPAAPTGTTATTPGVMMGMGSTCAITPTYSTRVSVTFDGNYQLVGGTNNGNSTVRFGTGAAPANGAAPSGTAVGATIAMADTGSGNLRPFSQSRIITGLTAGVAIWLDLAVFSNNVATTISLSNMNCVAEEF